MVVRVGKSLRRSVEFSCQTLLTKFVPNSDCWSKSGKEENPYSAHHIFIQCLLLASSCTSTEDTILNKQTNSLTSRSSLSSQISVCLRQWVHSATYQSQSHFSQVAQNEFIACSHFYTSFYPMICLGFNAKFLLLPKHHLRTRKSHTHKLHFGGVHRPVALV